MAIEGIPNSVQTVVGPPDSFASPGGQYVFTLRKDSAKNSHATNHLSLQNPGERDPKNRFYLGLTGRGGVSLDQFYDLPELSPKCRKKEVERLLASDETHRKHDGKSDSASYREELKKPGRWAKLGSLESIDDESHPVEKPKKRARQARKANVAQVVRAHPAAKRVRLFVEQMTVLSENRPAGSQTVGQVGCVCEALWRTNSNVFSCTS
jgi:hypothetical protein